MDMTKLDFIDNYFLANADSSHVYIVLHSLFNCITEEEISILYFYYAKENPDLKRTIESYILKRTTNEPKRNFAKIGKILLSDYPKKEFREQQSIRKFLSQFIRTMPLPIIKEYFDLLIDSDRKWDRHQANNVADLLWNDEVERKLIDNFLKFEDDYSLLPLIKSLDPIDLGEFISSIWSKDFPSAKLKSQIVKKIANSKFDDLVFLEDIDPTYYLHAITIRRETISDVLITKLQKNLKEENKYYLIWCLSLTRDFKLITKYLK